jgi:hypothetical protein
MTSPSARPPNSFRCRPLNVACPLVTRLTVDRSVKVAPSARPSAADTCAVMSKGAEGPRTAGVAGCDENGAMNSINSSRFRLRALIVSSQIRRDRSFTAPVAASWVMSERASSR